MIEEVLSLFHPFQGQAAVTASPGRCGSEDVLQVAVHQSITVTSSAALGI